MINLKFPITREQRDKVLNRWHELAAQAERYKVKLNKDGSFEGAATGQLLIGQNELEVNIKSKPFFVPESMIKNQLTKMVEEFLKL